METIFWISAVLVCYGYIVYPLVLLIMSNVHSPWSIVHSKKLETLPAVSLVVAAYNEEGIMEKKIKNTLSLDYPREKLEVVIASDGSTDATNSIVARYAASGIRLVRYGSRSGKVNVLNRVVPQAKGEIIVFSDANTIFEADVLKKLLRNFANEDVGCVCGELKFYGGQDNEVGGMEGIYWRYEQFMKRREGARGSLLGANGGIYAVRKNLFTALPANTIVEDFVLPMKILEKGYKVVYEPEAAAYEETSKRMAHEMERRIRIGAGDFQALMLTWRLLDPRRGLTALSYFSHKVIRWFAPFLLIAAFLSNAMSLGSAFFNAAFAAQAVFYITAASGGLLSKLNVRSKAFGLPYYFVWMNIALFLGFIRFCANSQSAAWQRTKR